VILSWFNGLKEKAGNVIILSERNEEEVTEINCKELELM